MAHVKNRVFISISVFLLAFITASFILAQNNSYAKEAQSPNQLKTGYYCNSPIFSPYTGIPALQGFPYEAYMKEMEEDDWFASGFIAWKTTNFYFNPSDLYHAVTEEDILSETGFFEAALFDLFFEKERGESFLKEEDSLTKTIEVEIVSSLKTAYEAAFGTGAPAFEEDLSDAERSVLLARIYEQRKAYYDEVFGSIEPLDTALSDAYTLRDISERLSKLLALKEISDNRQDVLQKMYDQCGDESSYENLKEAIKKIQDCFEEYFNGAELATGGFREWALDQIIDTVSDEIWQRLVEDLGGGWEKLVYSTGKAALNEWLSTDSYYESYMQMYALKTIKGVLDPVTLTAREQFEGDPKEENAALLHACVELNHGYEDMAYEYSIAYLTMLDEMGINTVMHMLGYPGTDGSDMIAEYEEKRTFKNYAFAAAEMLLGELSVQGLDGYDEVYSEYYTIDDPDQFNAFYMVCLDLKDILPDRTTNLGISCGVDATVTKSCQFGRGSFGSLVVDQCQLTFNGDVSIYALELSDGQLMAGGDLDVAEIRKMESEADLIHVKGDASVSTSYGGSSMTAGTIELEGDLEFGGKGGFLPTETCKIIFCGNRLQTVKGSMKKNLHSDISLIEIRNPLFTMDLATDSWESYGWPSLILMTDTAVTYDGNIQAESLDLNGHKLITAGCISAESVAVQGADEEIRAKGIDAYSVAITNSTLYADGDVSINALELSDGQLMVGGDLNVSGIYQMNRETDLIHVKGNAHVSDRHSGSNMTAGTIELEGDLEFGSDGAGYCPKETCKTVFCGTGRQSVYNGNGYLNVVVNTHKNEEDLAVAISREERYIYDPDYHTGDRYIQLATIMDEEPCTFDGESLTPALLVYYDNSLLEEGRDFLLSPDEQGGEPGWFTISGIGKYKGSGTLFLTNLIIECKNHEYGEWSIVREASCTEPGEKERYCLLCGAKDETDGVIPATGHKAGEAVIENKVEATCETAGSFDVVIYCTICEEELSRASETIDAPGHKLEKTDARESTCRAEGNTEYYSCSECGKFFSDEDGTREIKEGSWALPKKEHTPETVPGKEASCTENGLTEGSKCSVCGEILTVQVAIPATGHAEVTEPAVAPTCTETGLTAGSHCSVCGKVIRVQETVPATGHNWDNGKVTTAATCTTAGVKTFTCTVCGETKTEPVARGDHKYENRITPATLTKNGCIEEKCIKCGSQKSRTTIFRPTTFRLSATSCVYNGSAKKPTVTVTDMNGRKIAASNYEVKYKNNKNVGRATVTVTFRDGSNYEGTKSLNFTISPKATTLSKVTGASRAFTAKWKRQATQTTGCQIQYSTNKNFKSGNKTVTVSKNTILSKKISGLKAKTTYYVRVRTYKVVGGKKYYSAWSKAKTVKTK